MAEQSNVPYDIIGGKQLSELVDVFYSRVSQHPDLAPIFPDDLTETARKQKQFLTQFLGGPSLYTNEHGHPMLRARHMPFPITPARAAAWLSCMEAAMDDVHITGELRAFFFGRLKQTAFHMVNRPDDEGDVL
ncbi:globin [Domibacillus iocasae]|uniref:Globin n=1 Tax=Domibacillus iocasae TaxID=1714016 RepID=A0A1E7DLJ1_9BACI|nr:globin [Domibacillus iocasae]OES43923.1 globin [Domibacillus iocasae]